MILRYANKEDLQALFRNRNDELTRKNSHNSDLISMEEHEHWFSSCLRNEMRELFILEIENTPVGTSRLDFYKDYAEISWSIFPEHRCKGYGKILVRETLMKTTKVVLAEIKLQNIPSKKIAELQGFIFMYKNEETLHYVKANNINSIDNFISMMKFSRKKLETEKLENFHRKVSFGDLFSERTDNAAIYSFGEGTTCYDNVLIIGDVKIGKNVWIGPNVVLDGSGGLIIGDYVSISAGVQIYTHDTVEWAVSMGEKPTKQAPVKIGSGVYIGPNTIIQKGVTIGDQVIIGAMSFVNKNIPNGQKGWGAPIKILGNS